MKQIDPKKGWYTAQELAGLPGLPESDSAVMRLAKKNLWVVRRKLLGKGFEYAVNSLPDTTRHYLLALSIGQTGPVPVPAPVPVPSPTPPQPQALNESQLDSEIARERIMDFVADFDGSAERAIDYLNAGHHQGTLPSTLIWAMDHAWEKRRKTTRLNAGTLNNWKKSKKQRGRSAPLKRQKDMEMKVWYPLAIELAQRPQGSCKQWITDQIAAQWDTAWGAQPPSSHAVRRAFKSKISKMDVLKGRYTGSALAPHMPYTPRTAEGMMPWDEIHADGWNTHFTAPHPVTGEYVTYEVWHAHDVATRYVPPFSIGMSETFEVVAKCVENAVRQGGVMARLQTDSTKVVKKNDRFTQDQRIALADRVGFTVVHPVKVGNSQANGIAENFNTWLDKQSRELATYQAKGMDSLTLKRVKKITAKAAKAQQDGRLEEYEAALVEAERMGKGMVLRSYAQACEWLENKRQDWNNKPHSSLPKIADPENGRRRHMTPNESLKAALDEGWSPKLLNEDYIVHIFRAHVARKVTRGMVKPYGEMLYTHPDLPHFNGETVLVAYDPMNYDEVWVKTMNGSLICVANHVPAVAYRSVTADQVSQEKRAKAQIKHRENQIDMIRQRVGLDVIEGEVIAQHAELPPQAMDAATEYYMAQATETMALEARVASEALHLPAQMSHEEFQMWIYEQQQKEKEREERGDLSSPDVATA